MAATTHLVVDWQALLNDALNDLSIRFSAFPTTNRPVFSSNVLKGPRQ